MLTKRSIRKISFLFPILFFGKDDKHSMYINVRHFKVRRKIINSSTSTFFFLSYDMPFFYYFKYHENRKSSICFFLSNVNTFRINELIIKEENRQCLKNFSFYYN